MKHYYLTIIITLQTILYKHKYYINIIQVQIKIPITDGNTFSISFDAARQSPQSVASYFCNQRAKELGLLNQQDIDSGCVPSISTYILEQLASIGYTNVGNEDATNENVKVDNIVSNAAPVQEL